MSGITNALSFEPRLPDVAKWFADRSLPYNQHLEAALRSSEFGISSLEEMKVIEMIEWKTLLCHDPLSGEGYSLVKWRVFQQEFRKFAAQEFDGTKAKKASKGSKAKGKAIARKMKTGADLTSSTMINSFLAAGDLMSAAALVTKSKSKQQLKLLMAGTAAAAASAANKLDEKGNAVTVNMTSSTINTSGVGVGAVGVSKSKTSVPTSNRQSKVNDLKIDVDDRNFARADMDDEFAPKADDYVTARRAIVPPKVNSNLHFQDEISTINMSSYEHSPDDDNDTVYTLDEQKWNVKYADLLRYYKLYGTTHISLKANASKPRHILLRRWCDKQRKAFLDDQLSEEQIEKLVAVQFDFGQDIEELVAEQIEQERIKAEERRIEAERRRLQLKAEAERRRLEAEKRRLEEIMIQKEKEKKRLESTYVVDDVEGCVEAIYVF